MISLLRKMWHTAGFNRAPGRVANPRTEADEVPSTDENINHSGAYGAGDAPTWRSGMNITNSFYDDYPEVGEPRMTGDTIFRNAKRLDDLKSMVKSVRSDIEEEAASRRRNEAILLTGVESRNIIKLHGWYENFDVYYTALEPCDGGELFEHLASLTSFSEVQARSIARQLLRAVDCLHRQGIILRNLMPEHLLLTSDSLEADLKIANLETAVKSRLRVPPGDQGRSLEYSAPEVVKFQLCDASSDIWRVGIFMYIIVGGYLPFRGDKQTHLVRAIKEGKYKFPDEQWGTTTEDVRSLISRMLELDPIKRITAEEALKHSWMNLTEAELEIRSLLPSLNRFRLCNAKRKFKHVVFCTAHLAFGLKLGVTDEETARAYKAAEHFVMELKLVNEGLNAEEQKHCSSADGRNTSPSVQSPFDPYLRYTIVDKLGPEPKTYIADKYGVRLTAQAGGYPLPRWVGPILIQEKAQVVECGNQFFFLEKIVMMGSAERERLTPPLLLDFLVKPQESWRGIAPNLHRILEEYQILYKTDDDPSWLSVPPEHLKLNIVREGLSRKTFLQAKVHHLAWFSCGKSVTRGAKFIRQKHKKNFLNVVNSSGIDIHVVIQPCAAQVREYFANGGGANLFGGGAYIERQRSTETQVFPAAEVGSCMSLQAGMAEETQVLGRRGVVRLLIATKIKKENIIPGDSGDVSTLHLWGSILAGGGNDITLLKNYFQGEPQATSDFKTGKGGLRQAIIAFA